MKINSLLFVIVALLPMGLMAQSDITLGATYLPYESTILIHVVNSANKSMRIRNSYGASSGSLIQFHLKDKAGKEISLYDAVFYEGLDYQRFVSINPRSTKTFRFLLRHLCPSNHSPADVYSVDVSCFINYSIPEEERFEFIHKVLPIKTKQDLMIHSMYDSHNQDMMIVLYNTSDDEISVRNSGTAIKFELLDQQGTRLATRNFPFRLQGSGSVPNIIKIAPHSEVRLTYLFSYISNGLAEPSRVTTIEANCSALYDIPSQNITNKSSSRIISFKIK